ncbi:MAG TPA: zinc ABC transporter substrate-binding protein [Gaiellaceae bacterium]|nr:zinc ABC transporter substrate-binding protein [Gaiellaceae bacterium]
MRALAFLAVALGFVGCGGGSSSEGEVVAAFYPLAWATVQVAGPSSGVVDLTTPGAEPHDVELSPRDVETVRDADLVVYLGGGFQPALEEAVAGREKPSLDLLPESGDPHIWLDPVRFSNAVGEIGRALDRPSAAAKLQASLAELDAAYRRGLATCERRTFVTTHAAFGRLAARYGLTELSVAGRSPEVEPSPRELQELIDAVRASGATIVFAEPLLSDDVAETVAREAGVRLATLDPIEGLSQDRLDAGEDYLSVMRDNLGALREALGCR